MAVINKVTVVPTRGNIEWKFARPANLALFAYKNTMIHLQLKILEQWDVKIDLPIRKVAIRDLDGYHTFSSQPCLCSTDTMMTS